MNIGFILKFAGIAAIAAAAYYGHLAERVLIGLGAASYAVGYYFARFHSAKP